MRTRRKICFGIIGLGLMGREFASAVARWAHLLDLDFQPEIVGICDTNESLFEWYEANFPSINIVTTDYQDLLSDHRIEAIYCAVPHHLHETIYQDVIKAEKHLLGEKPFGINRIANQNILDVISEYPDVIVACSSELPFYPGAQRVIDVIHDNPFGQIIDVEVGLLHSSDMDPNKPINWKRMVEYNGEYGCMGDLGMHALHIPLRFGWLPDRVYAQLMNLMPQRKNAAGDFVACETWDNAILNCAVDTPEFGAFPMSIKTYRMAPGETNTWFVRISGTRFSISYSSRYPKSLYTMSYAPGEAQCWAEENLGHRSAYPTLTGGIFEFGFSDSILQMWAAFCDELSHGRADMLQSFHCATVEETRQQHAILTAALESHNQKSALEVKY